MDYRKLYNWRQTCWKKFSTFCRISNLSFRIRNNILYNNYKLLSGTLLAKNAILNLAGTGLPMIVAIFTIPTLIRTIGTERFGILSLVWVTIGYFGIFDFGLGRSLTKLVSERIGERLNNEIQGLAWTAFVMMSIIGIIGGIILACVSQILISRILNIPVAMQLETLKVFYVLSLSVPFIVIIAGFRGLLGAYQRFDLINMVRIPSGVFNFLAPLLVLPFSKSLYTIAIVLTANLVVISVINLLMCLKVVPELRHISWQKKFVKPLLRFGGWMSVSNIVGPIMLYSDRFFIAGFISVSAVAYYTTPYEVITKLLFIPASIINVMFPAFSHAFGENTQLADSIYKKTFKYVLIIISPIVLILIIFAKPAMSLWLNDIFAQNSFRATQFLSLGILMNSMGLVSQSFVQAAGYPDWTAKLHLIELPFYLYYLTTLLHFYGINGAAMAWLIRVTLSAIVLWILSKRCLLKLIKKDNKL